jgi:uncharacterized RDD family membrane protein YckC
MTWSRRQTPAVTEQAAVSAAAPPLIRRLLCLVYECVLLFGIVMLVGLAYGGITNQQHALQGQWGLRALLFFVFGLYFLGFWALAGQTLAMKTWHVRLEAAEGQRLTPARATMRFLLSWVWVLPGLALAHFAGISGGGAVSALLAAGVFGYAATALLHPERQFWHDAACGTRLVDTRASSNRV